jgi:hypothetical protein
MFSIPCPSLDREVLILMSTRELSSMTNTEHGIVLEFECPCGAQGVFLTGNAAQPSSLIYHQHAPELAQAA